MAETFCQAASCHDTEISMKKYKLLHIGMCTGENGFTKALQDNFADYRELHCGDPDMNHKAVELASSFLPDIVFLQIQTPGIIQDRTLKILGSLGSWICNFTGDVRQPLPQWYIDVGRQIDYTFFSNETDVEVARNEGVRSAYLNIGFDPSIYYPDGARGAVPDIVFMANHYPGHFPLSGLRQEVALRLKEAYGHRFGLYGGGWPAADGNWMNSQHTEALYYRSCKIAINCSHFDLERYSSDRILRIMGSGAFCLTKWFPGIERDYIDMQHVMVWHNVSGLIEWCKFYLENDAQRRSIAKAGCCLVHARDTFDHMVKNILQFYEQA